MLALLQAFMSLFARMAGAEVTRLAERRNASSLRDAWDSVPGFECVPQNGTFFSSDCDYPGCSDHPCQSDLESCVNGVWTDFKCHKRSDKSRSKYETITSVTGEHGNFVQILLPDGLAPRDNFGLVNHQRAMIPAGAVQVLTIVAGIGKCQQRATNVLHALLVHTLELERKGVPLAPLGRHRQQNRL